MTVSKTCQSSFKSRKKLTAVISITVYMYVQYIRVSHLELTYI